MEHLGGHLNKTHVDLNTLKFLQEKFNIQTMVDIGCGPGGMVELAESLGINATGIDGDTSLISRWDQKYLNVIPHDFTRGPFKTDSNWELAWSVEFLEHVEEQYINNYFSVFTRCNYAMVTAAPPGTPGHHHVNCQPADYWITKFDNYGFYYDDTITQHIRKISSMRKPFMQNNGLFFIRRL